MSQGRRSPYSLSDVLAKLQTGRAGAVRIQAGSPPFHEKYNKALAVVEAIDDLAEQLTGDREHFWTRPHG
ncbi:MAG: hypothetical protein AAF724_16800 [Pseudomonadota bacterium]